MGRKIAIIGTVGRDKNHPMSAKHWDFMCEMVRAEIEPDDHLMAFTFGRGDVPADGGTKMTWDMAAHVERMHLSLLNV